MHLFIPDCLKFPIPRPAAEIGLLAGGACHNHVISFPLEWIYYLRK
ncbi:hypothetical protein AVDCRST_MAG84-7166 [uncultured Microcoleus sp.]|uniref:Uncharacterized protein n=1 Tax=uncultured Microcoleus sp. TaxID=259945 RepID=A0A6J4PPN4_9CYAN|nr:hypothetical protein AVDCRST_MAG84-7166 [uncultured Microcoleus sp.]